MDYFICYTSTEALICYYKKSVELKIVRHFFKATAIKSILAKLCIKKITIFTSNDLNLTIAVLLNDESVYIYENISITKSDSWLNSVKLTKHIHPIERFYKYFDQNQAQDSNNSKYKPHELIHSFPRRHPLRKRYPPTIRWIACLLGFDS